MNSFAARPSGERSPVAIEYDAGGRRKAKLFVDYSAARRFYAAKLRSDKHPKVTKGEGMKLQESVARGLCTAIGYNVEKADLGKLGKKINGIPLVLENLTEPDTDEQKKLLADIVAAVENGDVIEIEASEAHSNGEAPPVKAKKEKKEKKEKAPKEPKAARAAGPGRDKYGVRLGTQSATINAAMSKKPRTAKEIAEKIGLPIPRVAVHMKWLIERYFVEKTDDGYALVEREVVAAASE